MIFSLTTIPPRSLHLDSIVKNCLEQTIKPEKIILNLPNSYQRFPKEKLLISEFVLDNVRIRRCEDIGPLCKIGGCQYDTDFLVVIDDDSIFPSDLVETYYNAFDSYGENAYCLRGRNITSSNYNNFQLLKSNHIREPQSIDIITHVWTAAYTPKMLRDIELDKYCWNDDIVVSGLLQKSAIEKWIIPHSEGCKPNNQYNNNDLWSINQKSNHTDSLIKQYFKTE